MPQREFKTPTWSYNKYLKASPSNKHKFKKSSLIYEERKWELKRLRYKLIAKMPDFKLMRVSFWLQLGKCPLHYWDGSAPQETKQEQKREG